MGRDSEIGFATFCNLYFYSGTHGQTNQYIDIKGNIQYDEALEQHCLIK